MWRTTIGLSLATLLGAFATDPLIVLYFESWAQYDRKWPAGYIDEYILSRQLPMKNMVINHAFLYPDETSCQLKTTDDWADTGMTDAVMGAVPWTENGPVSGIMSSYARLKSRYPNLKVMASLGGWSRSHTFHKCIQTNKRQALIDSIIATARTWNIDGVDFDWEYPNCIKCGCQGEDICHSTPNESAPGDWVVYQDFLRELRRALDNESKTLGRRLYLTMAIGINPALLKGGSANYPDPSPLEFMCNENTMDYVGLMTYDYFGAWDHTTGHNAPLFESRPDDGTERMSITDSIEYLLTRCKRPERLIMGLGSYGRSWKDVPSTGIVPGLYQTSTATDWNGPAATGTVERGSVSIWDIMKNYLTSPYCTRNFDNVAKAPTIHCTQHPRGNGEKNVFVTYDDPDSWSLKMEHARKWGMSGALIWASSEFGSQATYDAAGPMFGGLFSGWQGSKVTVNPPNYLGKVSYNYATQGWPNYPCPIVSHSPCPNDKNAIIGPTPAPAAVQQRSGTDDTNPELATGPGSGVSPTSGPGYTQPPVTQPPVTQPPVTQAPITQPPVTQAPITQAPATQPPVTQAPITQPPVTQAPITQPPVTQAPITQPPAGNVAGSGNCGCKKAPTCNI